MRQHLGGQPFRLCIGRGLSGRNAVAFRQLDDIRAAGDQGGADVAAAILLVLHFVHHAEGAVLHHNNLDVHAGLHERSQLAHAHLERAVAANGHDLAVRFGELCADGGRHRVAHRAQAAAGQKAAFLDVKVARSPDLVLPDVRGENRFVLHHGGQVADKQARLDEILTRFAARRVAELVVEHLTLPFRRHGVLHPVGQSAQHLADVADNRDIDRHILADFSRVDVDMNDVRLLRDLLGRADRAVAHARAAQDHQVRLLHRHVRAGAAIHADHAHVIIRIHGRHADAHHGRAHRDAALFRKGGHLFAGIGEHHAAAAADDGPLGLTDRGQRLFDLQRMALRAGLVAPDFRLFRIAPRFDLLQLHIRRHVDQHRARFPRCGKPP